MNQLPPIILYKGATSVIDLDLSEFDMQGGYVLFVISESFGGVVRDWRFDESAVHAVVLEDEFTASLDESKTKYKYGIMHHVDGERFAQCSPSPVEVLNTVGGYPHGAED